MLVAVLLIVIAGAVVAGLALRSPTHESPARSCVAVTSEVNVCLERTPSGLSVHFQVFGEFARVDVYRIGGRGALGLTETTARCSAGGFPPPTTSMGECTRSLAHPASGTYVALVWQARDRRLGRTGEVSWP